MKNLSGKLNTTQGQVNELQRFLVVLLNQSGISIPPVNGSFTLEAVYSTGAGPWSVVISGFNGQLRDENITRMTVDGATYAGLVSPDGVPFTVKANSSFLISLIVPGGSGAYYSAGQVIQVGLNSISGNSYNRSLTLPSGLQTGEKVIINAYALNKTSVVLTISNQGPNPVTITQILLNQVPVATGNIVGVLSNIAPGSGTTLTLTVSGQSGITYPITVVTAAGNSYPSTVTMP
jgi:hypothetical protein